MRLTVLGGPRRLAGRGAGVHHGHPDHCADLIPLLRPRALSDSPPPALPVYALLGALDAVLALDRPGMLASAIDLHDLRPGSRLEIGPFLVDTWLLSHSVPNAGVRHTAGDRMLAYTGDTGPSPDISSWHAGPTSSSPRRLRSTTAS